MTRKSCPSGALLAAAFAVVLNGCAENGGVDGFVQQANAKMASAISSVTGSAPAGVFYTPISGGHDVQNIFAADDLHKANYGQLAWPRVALTVNVWGANQPCWEFTATVWRNAKTTHDERFRLCDGAPIPNTDDTGTVGTLSDMSLISMADRLQSNLVRGPNTGDQRTRGPLPPRLPFNVQIGSTTSFGQADPLARRYSAMQGRLAALTHYVGGGDGRFWIWRFDPAGKQS